MRHRTLHRSTTIVGSLALGAAGATATILLLPGQPASGTSSDPPAGSTVATTVAAGSADDENDGCGAGRFPGRWGLRGSDGRPAWLDERLAELPAALRSDVEDAWEIDGWGERRDALGEIWDRALAGDYGDAARDLAEQHEGRPGPPWHQGGGPRDGWTGPWSSR